MPKWSKNSWLNNTIFRLAPDDKKKKKKKKTKNQPSPPKKKNKKKKTKNNNKQTTKQTKNKNKKTPKINNQTKKNIVNRKMVKSCRIIDEWILMFGLFIQFSYGVEINEFRNFGSILRRPKRDLHTLRVL